MEKVLIIEDDPVYCELIERCLHGEGFAVQSAGTLRDGLKLVREEKPDAVVLDLALPDSPMNETVEKVKMGGAAVILVVSGNPHFAEECIRQSASGFINKNEGLNYLPTEIRNAIRSFLKLNRIDSALNQLGANT